jgi:hypothetical protein
VRKWGFDVFRDDKRLIHWAEGFSAPDAVLAKNAYFSGQPKLTPDLYIDGTVIRFEQMALIPVSGMGKPTR